MKHGGRWYIQMDSDQRRLLNAIARKSQLKTPEYTRASIPAHMIPDTPPVLALVIIAVLVAPLVWASNISIVYAASMPLILTVVALTYAFVVAASRPRPAEEEEGFEEEEAPLDLDIPDYYEESCTAPPHDGSREGLMCAMLSLLEHRYSEFRADSRYGPPQCFESVQRFERQCVIH